MDDLGGLGGSIVPIAVVSVLGAAAIVAWSMRKSSKVDEKGYERGIKMVPLLIHLPPATDDVDASGRDARGVAEEEVSEAETMYQIIASTLSRDTKFRMYGQKHVSFEIIATHEGIKYYALVPVTLVDVLKQAVAAAYPTARLEEADEPNIFNDTSKEGTVGGELVLKKEYIYPVSTYQDTKTDSALAILNAMSMVKEGDGATIQIMLRPAQDGWAKKAEEAIKRIQEGKKPKSSGGGTELFGYFPQLFAALWTPPEAKEREKAKEAPKPLSNLQQAEIAAIESKIQHPGFETVIRVLVSSPTKTRAESILNSVVAVFSQFNSVQYNGFSYNMLKNIDSLVTDYIFRIFPPNQNNDILNSVELATVFHLPSQNAIPTSKVQKQMFKQVDGPTVLSDDGVLLGVNEFRGEKKEIRLATEDRRRHLYMIGGTGVGKTGFLHNSAYQDMMDGKGFAFIDPHGDAVEELMSMVPEERIDDVIYFDPGDMSNPIGMNMFEFNHPDQKDFIVQEVDGMLQSLYDPGQTGIWGPRGSHMFRNAALLLMSDPNGGTFIDIPRVLIDAEFRNAKLQYVTDRNVYDFWTKEFPASQKSSEAGEVITWFASKWGPFLSNTMMRNILGQTKSGFNIREIMDSGKILLVNLSKGKMGDINSRLVGMMFVMKFQAAAMSRADTPENERKDFFLYVDEFQNFSTESFESILSEARKYRLSLIVANQFMTQLTDKIREAIIGNIGTVIAGRIGITDAEILQKKFLPSFTAEDLTKLPNYQSIAVVLIHSVPSAPFSMKLLPPMGEANNQLQASMKAYSAATYGRPRAEVDAEIDARVQVGGGASTTAQPVPVATGLSPAAPKPAGLPAAPPEPIQQQEAKASFMDGWNTKKKEIVAAPVKASVVEPVKSSVVENTTATAPRQGAVDFKIEPRENAVVEKTSQPEQVNVPVVENTTPVEPKKPENEEVQERRIKIRH